MKILSKFDLKNSGVLIIVVISFLLIGLYGLSMAYEFTAPPTDGFSREVYIGEVNNDNVKSYISHVTAIPNTFENRISVISVEEGQTVFYELGEDLSVIDTTTLDLNLIHASYLEAYHETADDIVLYYDARDLYKVTIDLSQKTCATEKVAESITEFRLAGSAVFFATKERLSVLKDNQIQMVVDAPVESFDVFNDHEEIHLLVNKKLDVVKCDLIHMVFDQEMNTIKNHTILSEHIQNIYKDIRDIYVQDGLMTTAFVWRDLKAQVNFIHVIPIDLATYDMMAEIQGEFPTMNSQYLLYEAENQLNLLTQLNSREGKNIYRLTLGDDSFSEYATLTKTFQPSTLSNMVTLNGNHYLIFTDTKSSIRTIKGATDFEAVVSETTAITSYSLFSLLGTIVFYTTAALLIGVVYAFAAIQLPVFTTLATSFIFRKHKYRVYIQNFTGAAAHLYFKFIVMQKLMNHSRINFLQPKWIGSEQLLSVVLILMTVLSLSLTFRYIKKAKSHEDIMVPSFVLYTIYEVLMFTLLQWTYVITTLLMY